MINANKFGKQILDRMLYTSDISSNTIAFPKTPYLGLFTTMPTITNQEGNYSYTKGVEVQESTPSENKTYHRVALFKEGVSEKRILGVSVIVGDTSISAEEKAKDTAAGFSIGSARVANQDLIFFPEAEKEAYGNIVGFGIFESLTAADPYLWGTLSKDSGDNGIVTVNKNEIPIFRVGDFRIALS